MKQLPFLLMLSLFYLALVGCNEGIDSNTSRLIAEDDIYYVIEQRTQQAYVQVDISSVDQVSDRMRQLEQNGRPYFDLLHSYTSESREITAQDVANLRDKAEASIDHVDSEQGSRAASHLQRYIGEFTLKLLYLGRDYQDQGSSELPYFIELALNGHSNDFALLLNALGRLGPSHPDVHRLAYATLAELEAARTMDAANIKSNGYVRGLHSEPVPVDDIAERLASVVETSRP